MYNRPEHCYINDQQPEILPWHPNNQKSDCFLTNLAIWIIWEKFAICQPLVQLKEEEKNSLTLNSSIYYTKNVKDMHIMYWLHHSLIVKKESDHSFTISFTWLRMSCKICVTSYFRHRIKKLIRHLYESSYESSVPPWDSTETWNICLPNISGAHDEKFELNSF